MLSLAMLAFLLGIKNILNKQTWTKCYKKKPKNTNTFELHIRLMDYTVVLTQLCCWSTCHTTKLPSLWFLTPEWLRHLSCVSAAHTKRNTVHWLLSVSCATITVGITMDDMVSVEVTRLVSDTLETLPKSSLHLNCWVEFHADMFS